jgi:nucleoside phosphorylase/tetratricopeptide (TPR) repeat protein
MVSPSNWTAEKRAASPLPLQLDLAEVRGKVDFGIISIREDEFEAVLEHFPVTGRTTGRRQYNLSRIDLAAGGAYLLAMIRCVEQGGGEAQAAAHDLLDELNPRWLLVVGIAGARPSNDFGLGDVVVSTRIHDFSVEAVLKGGAREYNVTGGPLHPDASAAAANLPALMNAGGDWTSSDSILAERPPVVATDDRLEGRLAWRQQVKASLAAQAGRSQPIFTACAVGASDRLVRDPELLKVWLKMARHVCAVEMESQGLYRATHGRQIPFLAIRGISDVVGFSRDARWTQYACHSAAAFTHAFLRSAPIAPREPLDSGKGAEIAARVADIIAQSTAQFVGRGPEWSRLEALLEKPNGTLVLTASAGFGKTALLASWVKDHCARGWPIAYHFFSYRYNITRPAVSAYRNLLRQLLRYGDWPDQSLPVTDEGLRDKLFHLLSGGPRRGDRLVLVLDGLDEADGPFDPPFPSRLPDGLHVIISGRAATDEKPAYLRPWLDQAERVHLGRLPRFAIAEFLRRSGEDRVAKLAEDQILLAQVDEVTGGFPLYLRHLSDEMTRAAKAGEDPRLVLHRSPQGFGAYVAHQLTLLANVKAVQDTPQAQELFALLSVALEPLPRHEVQALTGLTAFQLETLPWEVARWLAVERQADGSVSYSLPHPLLREEFQRALALDAKRARGRLVEYCARWREHDNPGYALRHRAHHLAEAGDLDALLDLTRDEAYRRAQVDESGTYADVFRLLATALGEVVRAGEMRAVDAFATALRCVRIAGKASASVADAIPLARRGLWDPAIERTVSIENELDGHLALVVLAWLSADQNDRAGAERILARFAEEPGVRVWGTWGELRAVTAGRLADLEVGEPDRLLRLLGRSPQNDVQAVLEAFDEPTGGRALVEEIGPPGRAMLLRFALERARTIEAPVGRYAAFAGIARSAGKFADGATAAEILGAIIHATAHHARPSEDAQRDELTSDLLAAIADAGAEMRDATHGREVLDQVAAASSRVREAQWRARLLAAAAAAYARLDAPDLAVEALGRSFADAMTEVPAVAGKETLAALLQPIYEASKGDRSDPAAVPALAKAIDAAVALATLSYRIRRPQEPWEGKNPGLGQSRFFEASFEAFVALGLRVRAATILRSVGDTAYQKEAKDTPFLLAVAAWGWARLGKQQIALRLLADALEAALAVSYHPSRALALTELTNVFPVLGDAENATFFLDRVLQAAEEVEEKSSRLSIWESRSGVLRAVGRAWGRIGEPDRAANALERIADPVVRAGVYQEIGDEARCVTTLLRGLKGLKGHGWDDALVLAATAHACRGLRHPPRAAEVLEPALAAAATLDPKSGRAHAIVAIAEAWFGVGGRVEATAALARAISAPRQFDDDVERLGVIRSVVDICAGLRDSDRAGPLLEALTTTEALASPDQLTLAVAGAWARLGHPRPDLLEQVLRRAPRNEALLWTIAEMAEICATWGDTAGTKLILKRLLEEAGRLDNLSRHWIIYEAVAKAWLKLGQPARAIEAFGRLLDALSVAGNQTATIGDLVALLEIGSKLGDARLLEPLIARTLQVAKAMRHSWIEIWRLEKRVALTWADCGEPRRGAAVLERTLEAVRLDSMGDLLMEVATACAGLGSSEVAVPLLSAVLVRAESLADPAATPNEFDLLLREISQAFVIMTVAEAASLLGDAVRAAPLAARAASIANRIVDATSRNVGLTAAAAALARLGRHAEAASAFEQALASALEAADEERRAEAISRVAAEATVLGAQMGSALLAKILEKVRDIRQAKLCAASLAAAAKAGGGLGTADAGGRVLAAALAIAEHLDAPSPRAIALAAISEAWARLARPDTGAELLLRSIHDTPEADAYGARSQALEALAQAAPAIADEAVGGACLDAILSIADVVGNVLVYRSLGQAFAARRMESRLLSRLALVHRLHARRALLQGLAKAIADRQEKGSLGALLELVALEPFDGGSVFEILLDALRLLGACGDHRFEVLARLLLRRGDD